MKFLFKPTDLWHVGVAEAPIAQFLNAPGDVPRIHWLPLPGSYRFLADPFAHRAGDGTLTVFAEAFDYRTKRGEIHYYTLDAAYQPIAQGAALRNAHHLSYPYLMAHAGEIYMLPECYRSGALMLYRAAHFPDRWEPVARLLDLPAIDASIFQHAGRWWMFFSLPGDDLRPLRELHCAMADSLLGPWHLHPANPIHQGLDAGRMAGTPFLHAGALHLPLQDARHGYGSGITLARIETLSDTRVEIRPITTLNGLGLHPDYRDGMHTLSACGDVTLLDVKRIDHSPARRLVDLERRVRRLVGAA